MEKKCDFSGWATKTNVRCSDGRTIMKDAFIDNDGKTVPLVWNHNHEDPLAVLGHADLERRDDGMYAYCTFNDTESGQSAKKLVEHGDVTALSIYANHLKQNGGNVMHGVIREVSLVLAGANPEAFIDTVSVAHGDESDEEAIIYTAPEFELSHSDEPNQNGDDDSGSDGDKNIKKEDLNVDDNQVKDQELEHADGNGKTVQEVFDTLTDEQKTAVYAMIGAALEGDDEEEGEDTDMKQNVFEQDNKDQENVLSHSDMEAIITDAKRYGSMKESVLAHGIDDIDYLFPDAKNLNTPPEFIKRDTGWVSKVMNGVHHTPFSRIKSMFADITGDDARALGYIKGKLKKDEVFGLLKRSTTPCTIYKKQKLDRDDVIDITDFDVVAWLKSEMRGMLDEEIARAILIGDGRLSSSDDKINEQNIRPIVSDSDLFTVKVAVKSQATDTEDVRAKKIIKSIIRARKDYKGSGEPTFYTTEDVVTEMLLIEDNNGRIIYDSIAKLASVLRVKDIVTVPVMEGATNADGNAIVGLIVNLKDYYVGADKGGAVNMFDDFDIDYNAQKYLIETRCSGALIKPYAAMAISIDESAE